MKKILAELNRRNVTKVALFYVVGSWLIIQVADIILPAFSIPDWGLRLILAILALGFIPVVVFSWIYEMTPEGIKLEKDVDRSTSITGDTGGKINHAIMAALMVAIGLLLYQQFGPGPVSDTNPAPTLVDVGASVPAAVSETSDVSADNSDGRASIAVLPFVNMSGDEDNEYFSDGISEELLNVLVKVAGLRVPSRTSSFTFKGKDMKIAEIARELNVDHILEGSVRKSGQRVRITAQLIDVASDVHLWSETYTRELDDIFAVQDEIAHAIVDALKVTLVKEGQLAMRMTNNSEAYNLYLKGRYFWHQRTGSSFPAAIAQLENAVALDPEFARAWAGLADAYVLMPEYGLAATADALPKAREAIRRALELDPNLAQAITTQAYVTYLFDHDWAEADALFRKAIELDPSYATAHQWYSEMLATMRRVDESLRSVRTALELDPLSPSANMVYGNQLHQAGETDAADAQYDATEEIRPDFAGNLANHSVLYLLEGQLELAGQFHARFEQVIGAELPARRATLQALQGTMGTGEAVEIILQSNETCSAYGKAMLIAIVGDYDAAMDQIEYCLTQDDPYITHINKTIAFEEMRSTPRFQAVLSKLNFPDLNTSAGN